jgi:transcriptional regulator with XRE-family HTH domain
MENKTQEILTILANNIKSARTKLGYSQQELAEKADLSPGHMNDLEQGRKWVSADTLHRLATALMLEPWMLLLPDVESESTTANYDLLTRFASRMKDNLNTAVAETLQELLKAPGE